MVSVTSSATRRCRSRPHAASKMAIEGFTGSLAHELAAFDIRVKLIEPGYAPTTQFLPTADHACRGCFPVVCPVLQADP